MCAFPDYHANLHRRAVGRAIRSWREARGLSGRELADAAGWSTAKMSMLQASVSPISEADLLTVAMVLNVVPEERDRAHRSVQRACGIEPGDRRPGLEWSLAELEAEAVELRILAGEIVPPLFQTRAYTETIQAAHAGPCHPPYSPELRGATLAQMAAAVPLRVHLVLAEAVLRRKVGGLKGMADQLLWLVQLAGLQSFTLQVMPEAAGAHPGLGSSFTILSFQERQFDDVVYVPRLHRPCWVEEDSERLPYEETFAKLAEVGLPESDSLELVMGILDGT